jgi:hypothetical protein
LPPHGSRLPPWGTRGWTDRRGSSSQSALPTSLRGIGRSPMASASRPARRRPSGAVGTPQTSPGRPHRGRRIAPQALARLETRVRALTRRTKGASLEQTIDGQEAIDPIRAANRASRPWRRMVCASTSRGGWATSASVRRRRSTPRKQACVGTPGCCASCTSGSDEGYAPSPGSNGAMGGRQLSKRGIPRRLAAQTAGSAHGPLRGLLAASASQIGSKASWPSMAGSLPARPSTSRSRTQNWPRSAFPP